MMTGVVGMGGVSGDGSCVRCWHVTLDNCAASVPAPYTIDEQPFCKNGHKVA